MSTEFKIPEGQIYMYWCPGMKFAIWSLDPANIRKRYPNNQPRFPSGHNHPDILLLTPTTARSGKNHLWLCFDPEVPEDCGTRGAGVFLTREEGREVKRGFDVGRKTVRHVTKYLEPMKYAYMMHEATTYPASQQSTAQTNTASTYRSLHALHRF